MMELRGALETSDVYGFDDLRGLDSSDTQWDMVSRQNQLVQIYGIPST